jgi:alkylation response protein AidB-like acyl-CoA dehydrogenase
MEHGMTQLPQDISASLDDLMEVVSRTAPQTDASGSFPVDAVKAFLASGLGGLTSTTEVGGKGSALREASAVVARIGQECGSTAMIVAMHYSAVAVIETFGSEDARRRIAGGQALSTLAFSEYGSRSHFWAPLSAAQRDGDMVVLDARKSWVTSANHASLFVWSSQASAGAGNSIWLVERERAGIASAAPFDGMGLRGNDSAPVTAEGTRIPAGNLLGEEGKGGDIMLGTVLPVFTVLNASAALGLMKGAVRRTIAHVTSTGFDHLGQQLSGFPTIRAYLARMQIKTDMVGALIADTVAALESPGDTTMLRVLEVKAAAGEMATEVTDLAMRVCGGQAFRKEVGVERFFRDARASTVMAPTTDQLYDFIGRALCGLDLFA